MMVNLSPEEKLGIKLIVLLRSGVIKGVECGTCKLECKTRKFFHPDLGQFTGCPLLFIPNNIYAFLDEYDYYEKYPSSAPSYHKVNPKFWEAVKTYESYRNKIEKENNKAKPSSDTEENMSKMKSLFNK